MFKKINSINAMEQSYETGKIQGRMEAVNELIDLHDGNVAFLDALKEVQCRNGEMVDEIKKKIEAYNGKRNK